MIVCSSSRSRAAKYQLCKSPVGSLPPGPAAAPDASRSTNWERWETSSASFQYSRQRLIRRLLYLLPSCVCDERHICAERRGNGFLLFSVPTCLRGEFCRPMLAECSQFAYFRVNSLLICFSLLSAFICAGLRQVFCCFPCFRGWCWFSDHGTLGNRLQFWLIAKC